MLPKLAQAADIPVAAGVVDVSADATCSLIEALDNANDTVSGQPHTDCAAGDPAGADTVSLQAGATYSLTAVYDADFAGYGPIGLTPISTTVLLEGNGATITRDGPSRLRFFFVTPTGNLTLDSVILQNARIEGYSGGKAHLYGGGNGGSSAGLGGAIFNRGQLFVQDSALIDNGAFGADGVSGLIGNQNSSTGGGGGGLGGAGSSGQSGGTGGGTSPGKGGNAGNTGGGDGGNGGFGAGGGGGGAGSSGGVDAGEGGDGGFGGGGGGAGNAGFSKHKGAGGFGGGAGGWRITSSGYLGGYGGASAGMGGAIFNYAGTVEITNTTFSGNTAQGGNGGSGDQGGGRASGYGAALFNLNGSVTLNNVTIAENTVIAGTGNGGASAAGAAIYSYQNGGTATVTIRNSILANSIGGNDCVNNGGAATNTQSLIESHSGCSTPMSTEDPLFGSFDLYDGETPSYALLPGSPAIDAGDDATCAVTDQRGHTRYLTCDIGSYEFQGFTVSGTSGSGQSSDVTFAFPAPLTVALTANNPFEPLAGGLVTWTGPDGGAGILPRVVVGTIDASGTASATVYANLYTGSYIVTSTVENHIPTDVAQYALTNLPGSLDLSRIRVDTAIPDINDGDGFCSLIEAIANANDQVDGRPYLDCIPGDPNGPDTVALQEGEVYSLTAVYADSSGLPSIDTEITIEGNNATIVRDASAPSLRI
ncbi:MAG: hypothetical protein KDE31_22375, partial [Caldilineaceae bacterium]|nr:hypothetical protein [Caldilineaceae bacterium]